jgi:hypothetical protein
MHVGRRILLVHQTDFPIHIDKRVVLNRHKCSLVAIRVLDVLHAAIVFELSAESERTSPASVEHRQRVADAHLARERRVLKGRESAQERGAQQQAEIKELLIGLPAQVLLAGLLGDPKELPEVEIDPGDQLVDVEQEGFGGPKDGINERVVASGKVGKLQGVSILCKHVQVQRPDPPEPQHCREPV